MILEGSLPALYSPRGRVTSRLDLRDNRKVITYYRNLGIIRILTDLIVSSGYLSGVSLSVSRPIDRISSAVLRGVSHEGRLIGREACNQEQEGNRDTQVRQVQAVSMT